MLQNFSLLKTGVDVTPLLAALERKPELFDRITARQTTPGSPHRDTRAIFLLWCESQTIEAAFTDIPAVVYPELTEIPEAIALIQNVLDTVGSKELGRVLIAELAPGGAIEAHADEGLVADYYERFHLPLQSDEGNWFFSHLPDSSAREVVHMKQGEIWWFNHKRVHELENRSHRPRLHLIVDCVAPAFRRERDEISA
jgi:hypothetical protein